MTTKDSNSNKNQNNIQLAVMANDVGYIKEKVKSIETQIASNYVTKEEFDPIKRIVYGMVTIILVAFVGAIVALVVKK